MPNKSKPVPERTLKPLDKLYWSRVVLGISAGISSAYLGLLSTNTNAPNPNALYGVALAVGVYFISYLLARSGLGIEHEVKQKWKFITTGIGSYIMLFLFSWILANTLITQL